MKLNIKNIIGGAVLAAGAVVLPSCNDFLDVTQEKTLPGESIDYSDVSAMYEPVSGCYAAIRANNMHWIVNLLMSTRDGDVWSGRVDDQGELVLIGNSYVYNNSSFWGINEYWRVFYQIIRYCNEALVNLDNYAEYCSGSMVQTNRAYAGEVKIIRALAYYRLVQLFGDVPILFTNDQVDFTRYQRNVVYEYILQDLEYAMANTPKVRPNQMEHVGAFSAYTAETLAAKVCLNLGGFTGNSTYYERVRQYTQDIIDNGNFSLYPDYYQLWKIPGRLCDESIAECQVTDFGLGEGDYIGVDQFFNCAGPTISNDNTYLKSTGGWTFVGYFDSFLDWAYNRGETIRATTSFLIGGTTTPSGDYVSPVGNPQNTNNWNGKWYVPLEQFTPGRSQYGDNNNVRILRYADVLLMNAEAKVRLGQNGDAPFNMVRKRADMPEISNVTVDQILEERRMELCCEWGERYADLIRTGNAANVLGPNGWTPDKTYFPIPQTQIDLAPSLKNTPYTSL